MKFIVTALILMMSSVSHAYDIDAFTKDPIFTEPLAYTRSPGDIGFSLNTTTYANQRVYYLEGIIGRSLPLVTATSGELKLQLGLAASVWVALGYEEMAFPLITEDFYMGIPISFRYGAWSGSLAFNHISAHQGDGMDILLEKSLSPSEKKEYEIYESMAEKEGIGISIVDPESYSRDFLSAYIAYDNNIGLLESRMYWHFGYAHKIVPEELKRLFMGGGFEARYRHNIIEPYYSQDITWNADTDSVDYSCQAGAFFGREDGDYLSLRLAFIGFMGYDRRGQMFGRKDKRLGVGFFIR